MQVPLFIIKALLEYDVKMWPMEWRIKERKLNFVRQIMLKDDSTIVNSALIQEMEMGINRLSHECNATRNVLNIPEITKFDSKVFWSYLF